MEREILLDGQQLDSQQFYALDLCPGEVTPALQVFRKDTTRKAIVTGSKSNPVWRKDRRQGSFLSIGEIFAFH